MTGQAPPLETERLLLRAHTLGDFPLYAAMYADRAFVSFLDEGSPISEEDAWAKFLRLPGGWHFLGFGLWAIEEKTSRRFIGNVGFSEHKRAEVPFLDGVPEIGWSVAPHAQGKGYATEAARRTLAWIDSLGRWKQTACLIQEGNAASLRVAERAGFRENRRMTHRGRPMIVHFRETAGPLHVLGHAPHRTAALKNITAEAVRQ